MPIYFNKLYRELNKIVYALEAIWTSLLYYDTSGWKIYHNSDLTIEDTNRRHAIIETAFACSSIPFYVKHAVMGNKKSLLWIYSQLCIFSQKGIYI
jgi:hypothetical protein